MVKQASRELGIDDKLVPPRAALSRISQAKNRMEGPDSLRGAWNLRDEQIAKIYEKYITALRESNALDFDDLLLKTVELFETSSAGARALRPEVQVRHGRRVPGHQPAAVHADQAAGRDAPQPRRRRRPRSVDLQVARRRPAEHPRLRDRLRRREDRPPRAELPVDAGHPRRRDRRHPAEPQPQGQAAVDRSPGRPQDRLLPRRRRARGSRLHHASRSSRRAPKTSTR